MSSQVGNILTLLVSVFDEQYPQLAGTARHLSLSERVAKQHLTDEDWELVQKMLRAVSGHQGHLATPFSQAVRRYSLPLARLGDIRKFLLGNVTATSIDSDITNKPDSSRDDVVNDVLRQGLELYRGLIGLSPDEDVSLPIFIKPEPRDYPFHGTLRKFSLGGSIGDLSRTRLAQGLHLFFSRQAQSDENFADTIVTAMNHLQGHRLAWDNRVLVFESLDVDVILALNPALRENYERGESVFLCNTDKNPKYRGGFLSGVWTLENLAKEAPFYIKFKKHKGQMMIQEVFGGNSFEFAGEIVSRGQANWAPSLLLSRIEYLNDFKELYQNNPRFISDLVDELYPLHEHLVYYLVTTDDSAFNKEGKIRTTFRLETARPEGTFFIGFTLFQGIATLVEDWTDRDHEFPKVFAVSGLALEDPLYSLRKIKSIERLGLVAEMNPNLLVDWGRLGFDTPRLEYYLYGSSRGTLQNGNNIDGGLKLSTTQPSEYEPFVKIALVKDKAWIVETGGSHVYKLENALSEFGLARISPYLLFQRIRHLNDLNDLISNPYEFDRLLRWQFGETKPEAIWIVMPSNGFRSDGKILGGLRLESLAENAGVHFLKIDLTHDDPIVAETRGFDRENLVLYFRKVRFDTAIAYPRHHKPLSFSSRFKDPPLPDSSLTEENVSTIITKIRRVEDIRRLGRLRPTSLVELANEVLPAGQGEFYLCVYNRGSLQDKVRIARGLFMADIPPDGATYLRIKIHLGEALIVGGDGNHHSFLINVLVHSGLARRSPYYALTHFKSYDQLKAACDENPAFLDDLLAEVFPVGRPDAIYIFRSNHHLLEEKGVIGGHLDIATDMSFNVPNRPRLPYVKIDLLRDSPTIVQIGSSDSRQIADSLFILDQDMPEEVREAFPLSLDISLSDPPTETQIGELVKAIVAQDTKQYPGGDARHMTTSGNYFRKWYRLGTKDICLNTIAMWLRRLKGFASTDTKNFGNLAVVRYWKTTLFQIHDHALNEEELLAWINRHQLGDVVDTLLSAPDALEDFIRALYPDVPAKELGRALAGLCELGLGGGFRKVSTLDDEEPEYEGDALIAALMRRRDILGKMSQESVQRMLHAMKRHFELAFNNEPSKTIEALAELNRQADDPRVGYLVNEVLKQFSEVHNLNIPAIHTALKPFQKEGAHFLASRNAAIMADEPGMGKTIQAIAGAELLRLRGELKGKVLIICPASVKKGWARQLSADVQNGGHLSVGRQVVLIEGEASEKRHLALTKASDADYVIVNYEYLVMCSDEEREAILKNVTLKIVDEAQMVQNPSDEIQRARAVRAVNAEKTWYLTATPYYGRVEHIWTLLNDLQPGQHGTLAQFRMAFTKDENGWISLNRVLQDLMLRRVKGQVIGIYRKDMPLETQPLLLAEQRWIPVEEEGNYPLSPEQQAASLLLLTDFESFWQTYGDGEKKPEEIDSLERLRILFNISHNPKILGLNGVSTKLDALDEIVRNRTQGLNGQRKDQKIIIYTNRRDEAESLATHYKDFGSVLYWGGLSDNERERRRLAFQEGEARIIVGTEAMMLGIDLSAGDCLIFAQLPDTYTKMYQIADRLLRLDPKYRKYSVDIIRMVGRYTGIEMPTADEQKYLAIGSYDEVLSGTLTNAQRVFHMIMDLPHVFDMARLDAITSQSMSQDFFPDIKGHRRKKLSAGETFYPLYIKARSFEAREQNRAQEAVLHLAEVYVGHDEAGKRLCDMYLAGSQANLPVAEIEIIGKLTGLRHKNLKGDVAQLLPLALGRLHAQGLTLDIALADVEDPQALHLLAWLAVQGEENSDGGKVLLKIVDAVQNQSEESTRKDWEYKLGLALLKLIPEREKFAAFYRQHRDILTDVPLQSVVHVMEQLSTTALAMPDLMELLVETPFSSIEELSETLAFFDMDPYLELLKLDKSLRPKLRLMLLQKEPIAGFLDLASRYAKAELTDELNKLREIFHQVVEDNFADQRRHDAAGVIPYLRDNTVFWNGFNQGLESTWITNQGAVMNQEFVSHFQELLEWLGKPSEMMGDSESQMEHPFVWQTIRRYLNMSSAQLQDVFVQKIRKTLTLLAAIHEGGAIDEAGVADIQAVLGGIINPLELNSDKVKTEASLLERTLLWFEALGKMRDAIRTELRQDFDAARGAFTGLKRRYEAVSKGKNPVFSQLADIQGLLKHRYQQIQGKKIIIEDTDDWRLLLNVGQLFPDFVNCMATTGAVRYTRALIDMMGSRNKRMVVVRDAENPENILSVAFLKVRKDDGSKPVLHVERPFGVRGYKYTNEIMAHVSLKRERMKDGENDVRLGRQVRSRREKEKAVQVSSTGSIGKWEHTEDLFDVWQAETLSHLSLIEEAGDEIVATGSESELVGISVATLPLLQVPSILPLPAGLVR